MLTRLTEPGPGSPSEGTFVRQLRSWGRDVVRAIMRQTLRGDGRRIAVSKMSDGAISITYLEDTETDTGFRAYWFRGTQIGNANNKLIVRAGNVYTPVGTVAITEQSITVPASGDVFYWVQIDYTYSTPSVSGSWQSGAAYPALLVDTDSDGNYDRINLPICSITEVTTGSWKITQRQFGDAFVPLSGETTTETRIVDIDYSTSTGEFRKKHQTVQVVRGVTTDYGTTTWVTWATAADCTTTTT